MRVWEEYPEVNRFAASLGSLRSLVDVLSHANFFGNRGARVAKGVRCERGEKQTSVGVCSRGGACGRGV